MSMIMCPRCGERMSVDSNMQRSQMTCIRCMERIDPSPTQYHEMPEEFVEENYDVLCSSTSGALDSSFWIS